MNSLSIKKYFSTSRLKDQLVVLLFSSIYLIITALLTGLRGEHWLIFFVFNLCYFLGGWVKKFILAFTVFIVFGIIYDLMKVYPNYLVNAVDISGLYHFEQRVTGFFYHGEFFTPNEFFAKYHHAFLDVIAGFFYINWMPVPLALGAWLFFKNKEQFLNFSFTFLLVNLLGFCVYYIHPAAPPWYVANYGFDFHLNVPGNPGGLLRFDQIIGIPVFESIYSRNSNVFAALPSLHSAYPVVVFYYALKSKIGWIKWLLALFMPGIWFSAIYSGHHYVTDVTLGVCCALTGIFLYQSVLLKIPAIHKSLIKYKLAIS